MEKIQGYMLQSLRNVQSFLDLNHDLLHAVNDTGARRRLDEILTELADHAASQVAHQLATEGETRAQRGLRRTLLRDHMLPVARIARAHLEHTPGLQPLRMPSRRLSLERLSAAARGMADSARNHTDVFISAGLSEDFAGQLTAAADAMLASTDARALSRGRRTGSTVGLAKSLAEGRRMVNVLDAFVRRAVQDDPILLVNWREVKRVQRVARRPSLVEAGAGE